MVFVELTKKYERANKEEKARLLKAQLSKINIVLAGLVMSYVLRYLISSYLL